MLGNSDFFQDHSTPHNEIFLIHWGHVFQSYGNWVEQFWPVLIFVPVSVFKALFEGHFCHAYIKKGFVTHIATGGNYSQLLSLFPHCIIHPGTWNTASTSESCYVLDKKNAYKKKKRLDETWVLFCFSYHHLSFLCYRLLNCLPTCKKVSARRITQPYWILSSGRLKRGYFSATIKEIIEVWGCTSLGSRASLGHIHIFEPWEKLQP